VVGQRRDQVAGELDDPGVFLGAVGTVLAGVRPGRGPAGPQYLTDPALAALEGGQGRRDVFGHARGGDNDKLIVLEDADRHVIDPERTLGLVDDGPEQSLAIV
jgi:hypothetical protein